MEYKTELKPFKSQDGIKTITLVFTDTQIHTDDKKASSVGEVFRKSIESDQPCRIYMPKIDSNPQKGDLRTRILKFIKNDQTLRKTVQDYENKGYKVLIEMPTQLPPILIGKDTKRFVNSKKGKRIIRRLAKKNL